MFILTFLDGRAQKVTTQVFNERCLAEEVFSKIEQFYPEANFEDSAMQIQGLIRVSLDTTSNSTITLSPNGVI